MGIHRQRTPVFYILMSLGMVILFGSHTHLIRKPMTVRKIPISLPAMMALTGCCRVDSVIRWMIRLKTINSTFAIIVIRNWFIIAIQMSWNAGGDMLTTAKIRWFFTAAARVMAYIGLKKRLCLKRSALKTTISARPYCTKMVSTGCGLSETASVSSITSIGLQLAGALHGMRH